MRIAFYVIGNDRRSNFLNGITMRYGGASASGTDTSVILVAEHLASVGHDVVIACEKTYIGEVARGVTYTNLNFDKIENKKFDILVSMLWVSDYENIPITVTKGLIYWSHMQWIYGIDQLISYAKKHNLSIGLVHVSKWEEKMNEDIFSILEKTELKCKKIQIPNPIFDEMINEVSLKNINKKKNKFIFHALWTRGGDVAVEALRNLDLPEKEFHAFDYLMVVHGHTDDFFTNHQGVDKNMLFTHLAESEYFIYPLYTPYKDVHKDTFACTVAEAIALGVIVVTYPLGALPENFKDYCVWLDAPPNSDLEKMQEEKLSKDENGIFKYTKNIVDKINYLESNPEIKEQYRNKGRQYVLDNFNINKIGGIWENFINEVIN